MCVLTACRLCVPAGPDYKRKQSNLGERNDVILNDRNSVKSTFRVASALQSVKIKGPVELYEVKTKCERTC